MDILEFQGEHRWLSNFWFAKVMLDDVVYPSVEHAYQAAKTYPSERPPFLSCTAAEAKKLGRQVVIRDEWELVKLDVMRSLIEQKFAPGTDLAKKLLETGDVRLVEGNKWGDTFWGVCNGRGQNHLGEILMAQRSQLKNQNSPLHILEHSSHTYSPRTYENASRADLTVAFACDFTTAGEKLTHKAAGDRFVSIDLKTDPLQAARILYKSMRDRNARSLNVAGNGLYTLSRNSWTQKGVNDYIYAVLAKVHEYWPIQSVRSGGQTGADIAGIVAAYALKIPATALFPKGLIQRGEDKIDRPKTLTEIRLQVERGAQNLSGLKTVAMSSSEEELAKLRRFHIDGIAPSNSDVFVFGSNLAGRHGAGAAKLAISKFGAIYGQGVGRQGQSYAIPTKDGREGAAPLSDPRATLPIEVIKKHIEDFINYAEKQTQETFVVSRIGCVLAGYKDEEIAPLFARAPLNCSMPDTWKPWLAGRRAKEIVDSEHKAGVKEAGKEKDVENGQEKKDLALNGGVGRIRVVSKRKGGTPAEADEIVIDGDRKSAVFGNPHVLSDWESADERAAVIERFNKENLEPDLASNGPISREIDRLAARVASGEKIALACWCAPLPCHCDLIANNVMRRVMTKTGVQENIPTKTNLKRMFGRFKQPS